MQKLQILGLGVLIVAAGCTDDGHAVGETPNGGQSGTNQGAGGSALATDSGPGGTQSIGGTSAASHSAAGGTLPVASSGLGGSSTERTGTGGSGGSVGSGGNSVTGGTHASGGTIGTGTSSAGGLCNSGCVVQGTSTTSSYCPTPNATLLCSGPFPTDLSAIMTANGCTNIPTGAVRYCCPVAILTQCQ